MRLVMDAVSAIEWNGDNLDAIRTFVAPLTLVVKDDDLLLLLDSANRVYKIRVKDWLTRPENLKGTPDYVIDTREDDGFSSRALCILRFSQVKAEFRIELDESDDEVCTVCQKRLFNHTVLVDTLVNEGEGLAFGCPPDPTNEIDNEFIVEAEPVFAGREGLEQDKRFKQQVFARVAPQASEAELLELDSVISKTYSDPVKEEGPEITVNFHIGKSKEAKAAEAADALLSAQDSWRSK